LKVKKRDNNIYHIRLEHEDDLYHLNLLLDENDTVRALTERREASQTDRLRSERGKKQKMKLTINVNKVEYQSFGQRLRCHGVIAIGERDQGSHHTLILEPGDDFDIRKVNWLTHHKKRLREAAQPVVTALAICIESDSIVIAELRTYGLRELKTLNRAGSGKATGGEELNEFYIRTVKQIVDVHIKNSVMVVVGPGFLKDDFVIVAKKEASDIFSGCIVENSGQGGMAGINEAISRGTLPKAVSQIKIQEEMNAVELLKDAIAKDLATYGKIHVKNALENGAAEKLLILSENTRTKEGRLLLKLAEDNRTEIVEISSHHHGGEMLNGLGNIAVILRYRLT
jgi:protein pelota